MKIGRKMLLGTAAIALASAASFPGEIGAFYRGSYPTDWSKRQALSVCELTNATFVRYLASERADCYARMRNTVALGDRTGVWSKHDRARGQLAQAMPSYQTVR